MMNALTVAEFHFFEVVRIVVLATSRVARLTL